MTNTGTSFQDSWFLAFGWPIPVWILILVALAILVRWIYFKTHSAQRIRRLWPIRFAAVALAVILLADISQKQIRVELPELVLAIDDSRSSNLPNGSQNESRTRFQAIKKSLKKIESLNNLNEQYRIRYVVLGNKNPTEIDSDKLNSLIADQPESRIGDGLINIVGLQQSRNTAAIAVFSDGAVTAGKSLTEAATISSNANTPIFCIGVGSEKSPPNIRLVDVQSNRRVRVNQPLEIQIQLQAEGLDGQTCQVTISEAGNDQVLVSQQINITSDSVQKTVPLQVEFESHGNKAFIVKAECNIDEADLDDNQFPKSVQVVDGKTRVLIVQNSPDPWYRFLKELLLRAKDPQSGDEAFEVQSLLQNADVEYAKSDSSAQSAFPSSLELDTFDVIVLGDVRHDPIGNRNGLATRDWNAIKEYVRFQAGNVIFVPGYVNLDELNRQESAQSLLPGKLGAEAGTLPDVDPGESPNSPNDRRHKLAFAAASNSFAPTQFLQQHFFDSDTSINFAILPVTDLNPSVVTLAKFEEAQSGKSSPAITLQKVGNGNVITHLSNELYRLRYRSDQDLYQDYWTNLVTELASERLQNRDQIALLRTDATIYSTDQSVEILAEIFDPIFVMAESESLDVILVDESGTSKTVTLNRNQGLNENENQTAAMNSIHLSTVISDLREGIYQVILSTPANDSSFVSTTFQIVDQSSELSQLSQQREPLEKLALISGGMYYPIDAVDQMWNQLPKAAANQIGNAKVLPVWSGWFVPLLFALLIIALLCVEWILRDRVRTITQPGEISQQS